jgi:hypothetical protein
MQTGLSIFVHDNMLREVIMGKQCLLASAAHDPMEKSVGARPTLALAMCGKT